MLLMRTSTWCSRDLLPAEGVSAFIVEKDTPGFEREASLELVSPHAIGTLRFHDCVVPHENLLGPEGRGLRVALKALEVFRPSVGARAIGLSRRGLKFATEWAQRRIVFGQPLITQQAVSFTLAEMAMRIHTARSVVYDAARRADRGDNVSFEGSVAKAMATETAQSVAYQAQQIFGGRGVLAGNPAEQLARQVRAMTIYEGTSEILRVIIGRHVARGTYANAWEF
jgi:acyl-CoA dehydrogenase